MPKLTFLPSGKSVSARVGQNVIHAARSARVVIPQRCGGHASCMMCKVVVEKGHLSPPSALEVRKLPESDLQAGIRLSCQAHVTREDCTVRIPEPKLKSIVAAALKAQQEQEEEF